MFSRKHRSLGITRLEMGFLTILVIFAGLLAVTKYLDLSILVEGSMEQGVITAVRENISAYAEKSRERGSDSLYPPLLDAAEPGGATPQNLFFSKVLEKGIAVDGWAKTGPYEYRTPSGNNFTYDPQTGDFKMHGSMAAENTDHSSQIRQPDTNDR